MRAPAITTGIISAILAFNPVFSAALAGGASNPIVPVAVPSPSPSPAASPMSSPSSTPTPEPSAAPSSEPSAAPTPRAKHINILTNAIIAVAFVVVVIALVRPHDVSVPGQSLQKKSGLWLKFHFR